jgi:hypothetical protein
VKSKLLQVDKVSEEGEKQLNKRLPGFFLRTPMDSPGLRDLLGAECHGECLAVDQYNLTMFKESTRIGWHMMGQFTVFVCFYHV